jgi:chemotaxis family two-component system response regulator Rcp1
LRHGNCLDILLIEDSRADARLIETVLRETQQDCELWTVRDGNEARDFLRHQGQYKNAPTPHLIVLDWYLPRESGDETLAFIKSDPHLHMIPVVVLSGSQSDEQVLRGYELLASCWVVKAQDLTEAKRRLRALIEFWSRTAQLPRLETGLPSGRSARK